MRNDILSAVIPQATRFVWNKTTHVVIMAIQIAVPIMERITSWKKKTQFLHHESCKAAICIHTGLGEWNKPALLNYFRKCRNKDGIQYYNLRML